MNDNTAKLIEQLAQKLGTTSQYLWSVLIKQAPIDAITTLIIDAFIIVFAIALYKVHKRLLRKEEKYEECLYEKYDMGAAMPMVFAGIILVFLTVFLFATIGDVVNGFLNPEYWALSQVISKLKN